MSQLDDQIASALARLGESAPGSLDMAAYIAAFSQSARNKAAYVLERLQDWPFAGRRPVFVSVGGGDGAELDHLLRHSSAHVGVLVEAIRELAEGARTRNSRLGGGRTIEVFEGDAQEELPGAVRLAYQVVSQGKADFVAVTCHAVLHELYDRSRDFDAQSFMGRIFENPSIPTWFSYREPGVPEGWPETVLVRADCSAQSLLNLANVIAKRHRVIDALTPRAQVMGDHVRLHRTAAMELIVKLFYLKDLQHEINERSTSVIHSELIHRLHLAIGLDAIREGRGAILPSHAPTQSFVQLWRDSRIEVLGMDATGSQMHLGTPPSQARIVAWRYPATFVPAQKLPEPIADPSVGGADLIAAQEAERTNDADLLSSLLISRGRAWIELQDKSKAIEFLNQVSRAADPRSLVGLWSGYLLAIERFFADHSQSFALFAEEGQPAADKVGLGPLFAAERMEGCRKHRQLGQAVILANRILDELHEIADPNTRSSLDRYVEGTARFLVANFLRQGGQYAAARELVELAQTLLNTAVPSHATELRHCQYALQVCAAMLGEPGSTTRIQPATARSYRFAEGLLQLTYAHASWAIGQFDEAIRFVAAAATDFEHVRATRYVARAVQTKTLLTAWRDLAAGRQPTLTPQESERAVGLLTAKAVPGAADLDWLQTWLAQQRPSRVLGLLQFAKQFGALWDNPLKLVLPGTLEPAETGHWKWAPPATVKSLKELDAMLRARMAIAPDRPLPLLAD